MIYYIIYMNIIYILIYMFIYIRNELCRDAQHEWYVSSDAYAALPSARAGRDQ